MARVAVQLTNFTGGELSPRLDGRNDLAKYASGCKTLQNRIVYPHGSAARRPGTSFVAEVKTSSAFTRLVPFEFSTTQTYILEFGNEYIRFYKDSGSILESNLTISGITKANPGVVTGSFSTSSYPIVQETAVYTSSGSAVTTAPVTMPINIITGDLLIMVAKLGSTGTATTPTGWTLLSSTKSKHSMIVFMNAKKSMTVEIAEGSALSMASKITMTVSPINTNPTAVKKK